MLIDWFTVAAQTVNFVVLVWLLKRFLYRPVLDAVDAREKRIANLLAEAEQKRAEAATARTSFQQETEQWEQQRAALLKQAQDDAAIERRRLIEQARKTADALASRRAATLIEQADALGRSVRRAAQTEVFAIARKVLIDLASPDLEARIGELFAKRLRALDADAIGTIRAALNSAQDGTVVSSAFELSEVERAAIQSAFDETVCGGVTLRFRVVPDLICGVELTTSGHKVAWSIADYLTALEEHVRALLRDEAARLKPAPPSPAAEMNEQRA